MTLITCYVVMRAFIFLSIWAVCHLVKMVHLIFASLSFALVWRALFVSRVQAILTYGTASYVWRE